MSVGDKTIDAGSVEDQIEQEPGVAGRRRRLGGLPGGQKAEQGTTFECTVAFADGSTRTAQIELVDDEGTFNYSIPGDDAGGGDTGADTGGGADTGAGDTGATDTGE